MKIGLIINPIAGVGAQLAWKGTDDIHAAWVAVENGSYQPIWKIVNRAISSISIESEIEWYIGGDFTEYINFNLKNHIISNTTERSTREDTIKITNKMNKLNLDLLVFAGGDGTAIDIASVVNKIPIIGIPGGVKIFSPCFLHRPEDLGLFLIDWHRKTTMVDLFDLDEEEYKKGFAKPKLMGKTLIPISEKIQIGKSNWNDGNDNINLQGISKRIIEENLLDNKSIIVGAGSTMQLIMKNLNINKTLLGVAIINNYKIIKSDCTYNDIIEYTKNNNIDEIWLSPIGSQGHIFGRGNRQIPLSVIKSVNKNDIKLFSTFRKILETPILYTDTGDSKIDIVLTGFYKVITSYHNSIMRKVMI